MTEPSRKVVMSKKVAAKYIRSVSAVKQTMTVYFNDDRTMKTFVKRASDIVRTKNQGSGVTVRTGFDYATFVIQEIGTGEIEKGLKKLADTYGLDYTEM